jgi:hypothetical protein
MGYPITGTRLIFGVRPTNSTQAVRLRTLPTGNGSPRSAVRPLSRVPGRYPKRLGLPDLSLQHKMLPVTDVPTGRRCAGNVIAT